MDVNQNRDQPNDFRKMFPITQNHACAIPNRDEVIETYILGNMTPAETDAFDEHLFYCDACFQEVRFRENLAGILRERAFRQPTGAGTRVSVWSQGFRTYWPVAAAIVAVVGLAFWGRSFIATTEPRREFSENFQPSPTFEGLVASTMRSPGVTILSPENGAKVRDEVLFEWQGGATGVFRLSVYNNKEEAILRVTPPENRFLLDVKAKELPPGRYYWKLISNHELLHVGEFFINN